MNEGNEIAFHLNTTWFFSACALSSADIDLNLRVT